jgi:hypothetical protein
VCGRTACTVRCGGGRQQRQSGQHAPRGRRCLPPTLPSRRPPSRDPSRSRCCIREKQRRRADCSYPCKGVAIGPGRRSRRAPVRPVIRRCLSAARSGPFRGRAPWTAGVRSPRRASSRRCSVPGGRSCERSGRGAKAGRVALVHRLLVYQSVMRRRARRTRRPHDPHGQVRTSSWRRPSTIAQPGCISILVAGPGRSSEGRPSERSGLPSFPRMRSRSAKTAPGWSSGAREHPRGGWRVSLGSG